MCIRDRVMTSYRAACIVLPLALKGGEFANLIARHCILSIVVYKDLKSMEYILLTPMIDTYLEIHSGIL